MLRAYTALASRYDDLMHDFDYDGYFEYIKGYLLDKKKGVDLCSGSGELTIRLASIGKSIIGIDSSSEMLDVARAKSRSRGLPITYIEQDATMFELPSKVDFVTICCDGVNYIKDEESLYSRVYDNLKAGGVLVFDYSTEYKLREIIGNNVFYEDYNDYTYLWANRLDTHSVKMDITFFVREQSGLYSREDETQRQYIHRIEDTLDILDRIGFDVRVVDGETYGDIVEHSRRALFMCNKR